MYKVVKYGAIQFTLGCLLLMSALSAQDVRTFSLEQARQHAMKNNFDVRKALLGIEAANRQMWEVTATGFPQIEISADYTKLIDIPTQLIPGEFFGEPAGSFIPVKFGVPHNATVGATVSQLIFNGSYLVGVQASRVYLQLSKQAMERTKDEIRETVSQTYYMVLIAEQNLKVLQDSRKNLEKTHYEISEMYKEGFVEATDVKQLQITLTQIKNRENALKQQIDVAYKLLKLQLGLDLDQNIRLSDNLKTVLETVNVTEELERPFQFENNAGYRLLQTSEELADLSLKNEYSTFLPTIAAFASVQREAQRREFDIFDSGKQWFKTTVAGVKISWPIFSGGSKIFKIQKSKIELKQAQIERENAARGLTLQYAKNRSALISAENTWRNSAENRLLAKEVYNTTLEKYKEGMVSSLDLVQSHNQYLQAEGDYLQSVSDLLNAHSEMNKLLNVN